MFFGVGFVFAFSSSEGQIPSAAKRRRDNQPPPRPELAKPQGSSCALRQGKQPWAPQNPPSGLRPLQVMLPNPHPWDDLTGLPLSLPGTKEVLKMVLAQLDPVTHFWVFYPQECGWVRGTPSTLPLSDPPVPPAWLSPALAEGEESRKSPWRIPTHQMVSGHFGGALELSANAQSSPPEWLLPPPAPSSPCSSSSPCLKPGAEEHGKATSLEARRVLGTWRIPRAFPCCFLSPFQPLHHLRWTQSSANHEERDLSSFRPH